MSEATETGERRAETFELFFDLMFVFAITQITHLIETAHAIKEWIAAVSVLLFLWWMYAGFVWLASNSTRMLHLAGTMLVAMLAFFLMASGIPQVHQGETALLGWAALAIVAIHSVGFVLITDGVTGRMVLSFSWVNALAALLLLLSGFLPLGLTWLLQLAVILLLCGMAVLYSARTFTVLPSHFVERHGLLLIIVFGESIIAVGGTMGIHPAPATLLEASLTIALVAALWLSWFSHDDRRSERVLRETPSERRGRLALVAYWFAFAIMIFGVLLLAAGMKLRFEGHAQPAAWIAAATAFYFAGMALFRWELGLPGAASRVIGALLAFLIWPLGNSAVNNVESSTASGLPRLDIAHSGAFLPLVCALVLAVAMLITDRIQLGPSKRQEP